MVTERRAGPCGPPAGAGADPTPVVIWPGRPMLAGLDARRDTPADFSMSASMSSESELGWSDPETEPDPLPLFASLVMDSLRLRRFPPACSL